MQIREFLEDAKRKGLKRRLREVVPLSARECIVGGIKCLDFSSNNYLALADHPKLVGESVKWTKKFGAGSKASRLVTGTFKPYVELEERIAEWKKTEAALIVGSGYLANVGAIPALAGRNAAVFADKLNHASLNAGCVLSGAEFRRYKHNDMARLSRLIENEPASEKIIVTDTVFSMDGDVAPVADAAKIAGRHGSLIYFDDAHATGVFGKNGEGLASGDCAASAVCMGTFSKAMGSYGAYLACSSDMKEFLVNRCASFIYSTALPPGVYGAISAALELVKSPEFREIRKNLLRKSADFTAELRRLGFNAGNTSTPIVPVIFGESGKAVRVSRFLLENGILAAAIRPPTVPEGTARLRISLNAAHTEDDISLLLEKLNNAAQAADL